MVLIGFWWVVGLEGVWAGFEGVWAGFGGFGFRA